MNKIFLCQERDRIKQRLHMQRLILDTALGTLVRSVAKQPKSHTMRFLMNNPKLANFLKETVKSMIFARMVK